MRRVAGAEGEIEEERPVGRRRHMVGEQRLRLVDQILAEVVVVAAGQRSEMLVLPELGRVLVVLAAEEAVVAVEAALGRPVPERADRAAFRGRRQMPLAEGVGSVAAPRAASRRALRPSGSSPRGRCRTRCRSRRDSPCRPRDGCARSAARPASASTSPSRGSWCSAGRSRPAGRSPGCGSRRRSSRAARSRSRRGPPARTLGAPARGRAGAGQCGRPSWTVTGSGGRLIAGRRRAEDPS